MSVQAIFQGIEPFVAPDVFTLPAGIPAAVRLHPEDLIEIRENYFLLRGRHFKLVAPWPTTEREPETWLRDLSPENKQWQSLWQPRPFRQTRTGAEAAESMTFRSERINACLDHANSDVRTLADFDPSIYSKWLRKQYTNATASTGARVAASGFRSKLFRVIDEVGLIERELPTTLSYHDLMMKQAESEESAETSESEEVIDLYSHWMFIHQIESAWRVARLREDYERQLVQQEGFHPRHFEIKEKPKHTSSAEWQKFHANPDPLTVHKPTYASFSEHGVKLREPQTPKRIKIRKLTKDEHKLSDEISGLPPEPGNDLFTTTTSDYGGKVEQRTRRNQDGGEIVGPLDGAHFSDENATENNHPLDHTDLEARRKLNANKKKKFPIEIFEHYTPIAEVAKREGVSEKTMQKRVERFEMEAEAMEKGYPEAKDPITDEQWDDIMERGAAYLLAKTNEWTWYNLDLETNGSVGYAVAALRRDLELKALERRKEWRSGTKAKQTATLKEVKAHYDKVFNPSNIFIMQKPAWMGVLAELVSK